MADEGENTPSPELALETFVLREEELTEFRAMLTPREQEVFGLLLEDAATDEIAQVLGMEPKTVYVHKGNIMRKWHARSA